MTDDTVNLSMKYFSSDYNCSQAVMKALLEEKGMDFDEIFHLAAGFGGGFGLEGHVCGAVSGAVAAIGVLNGRKHSNDVKHRKATYPLVKKFLQRFTEKYETINCNNLTGIDISVQAELDQAIKDGTFEKVCPRYVKDAVLIVLDLMKE